MIRENNFYKLGRDALILLLSVSLVLFVQWIKLVKNPKSTPITPDTFAGLGLLWLISDWHYYQYVNETSSVEDC